MSLGQQSNRPVTPFVFTITTIVGEPTSLGATVDNAGGVLVEGVYDNSGLGYATTTDGGGTGCTVSLEVTAGLVPTLSIVTKGIGYAVGDSITLAESLDFSDADTGTIDSTVSSVTGAVNTVTVTDGGTGWLTGDIISVNELESDLVGTGLTGTVTANAGVVSGFTVVNAGINYVDGDTETISYIGTGEVGIPSTDYVNHNLYELGGVVTEYTNADLSPNTTSSYTPSGSYTIPPYTTDNTPTIKTVRKPDMAQLSVQKKTVAIVNGNVTVYAEPTIVDKNGYVVGNTVRAEDIVDKSRCQANGFFWNPGTNNTGDANQGDYGYCQDLPVTFDPVALGSTDDQAGCNAISGLTVNEYVSGGGVCTLVAASDDDCPVGYKFDGGTGCTKYTAAEVNALTQSSTQIKRDECIASGNHWEPKAVAGSECIDASTPGNFSLVNFNYNTTSSALQYAELTCKQYGHRWNSGLRTCIADSDHSVLTTKADCISAGHVWIAGACYDGADFGDGHNREGSFQQDPTVVFK